ncbi:hypothetical protein ACWD04_23785 [Streptomyces sp. NPDC002911]
MDWFRVVHDVLPFRSAAYLLRAGLVSGGQSVDWQDLTVLTVRCVLGLLVSVRALVRRA